MPVPVPVVGKNPPSAPPNMQDLRPAACLAAGYSPPPFPSPPPPPWSLAATLSAARYSAPVAKSTHVLQSAVAKLQAWKLAGAPRHKSCKSIPPGCSSIPLATQSVWNASCAYGCPQTADARASANCTPPVQNENASAALCSGHGICFFGTCFCEPGFLGASCGELMNGTLPGCARHWPYYADRIYQGHQDACLRNNGYGVGLVPEARWNLAQTFEARAWAAAAMTRNRSSTSVGLKEELDTWLRAQRTEVWDSMPLHRLGTSLGRVAEGGCGPYTQTLAMLSRHPGLHVASLSAIDPGIPGYLSTGTATYANGFLRHNHTDVPVEMLPIGAEALPACYSGTFDTVIFVNVIEVPCMGVEPGAFGHTPHATHAPTPRWHSC